ncbi:MAG: hypothetical protein BWY87_00214 [Deltaproteobacteria bacterium ADurb.Bin510]|nr:MAG: hypothetical protein BWY87_00214 [Deltaproteobacteria bacterium ADurb.Bin510]
MHVDVNLVRVDLDIEQCHRKLAAGKLAAVALDHGRNQQVVAHGPAVDIAIDAAAAGPADDRAGQPAVDPEAGRRLVEGGKLAAQGCAHDGLDAFAGAGFAGDVEELAAAGFEHEAHVLAGQRIAADDFHDGALLGGGGLHELKPGRGIEEELAHLDRGADRQALNSFAQDLAAFDLELVAAGLRGRATRDAQAADRGDAGQGLATEPQGVDGAEVCETGELAGGVAQHRESEVGSRHA